MTDPVVGSGALLALSFLIREFDNRFASLRANEEVTGYRSSIGAQLLSMMNTERANDLFLPNEANRRIRNAEAVTLGLVRAES